jgi:hypothetical protein
MRSPQGDRGDASGQDEPATGHDDRVTDRSDRCQTQADFRDGSPVQADDAATSGGRRPGHDFSQRIGRERLEQDELGTAGEQLA